MMTLRDVEGDMNKEWEPGRGDKGWAVKKEK